MKQSIIIVALVLLVVNALLGVAITSYNTTAMILNSIVIVANALLMLGVSSLHLHDGFRYSLYCLFSIATVVEFIIGMFSPDHFNDNGALIINVVLLAIEIILLLAANVTSKNVS